MLFKNKTIISKVQRIFTNSDYDHVALLLRTSSMQLLMLEATGSAGVGLYTMDSLAKINVRTYFERIGLRRF